MTEAQHGAAAWTTPPGFFEFHRISHVAALSLGYVYDLWQGRWGRIGIGGDATIYRVAENMLDSYGSPRSVHAFLLYRPAVSSPMGHSHMHE
jgi:hypothetical protein